MAACGLQFRSSPRQDCTRLRVFAALMNTTGSAICSQRLRAMTICRRALPTLLCATAMTIGSHGQTAASSGLEQQIHELQSELQQTRGDLNRAEQKIDLLMRQIEALRSELGPHAPAPGVAPAYPSAADTPAPNKEEAQQQQPSTLSEVAETKNVIAAGVEEQHQTEVESASKYRVKVSGLILMNAYSNRGTVDFTDLPNKALAGTERGSVGATVRQSILGLQVFGPDLAGAETGANISV